MGNRLFGFIKKNSKKKDKKNIFLLVGRNQEPEALLSLYENNSNIIENCKITVITPEVEWYPKPSGITNQNKSIKGLVKTSLNLRHVINDIINLEKIDPENTIIGGYSAGAVVAFQIWMTSKIKTCISHSGCILNVDNIILNETQKKCLLIHNRDDEIFTWEERYLPTRNSLVALNYDVTAIEGTYGGHSISDKHTRYVSNYLDLF